MQSLVTFNNERPTTTSLVVAQHFNKRHDNVLQSIESLIGEMLLCQKGNLLNFQEIAEPQSQQAIEAVIHNPIDGYFVRSEHVDARNRSQPMYEITEEGFALLAMGFTGPEALKFKIAFLNAFKQLAAENRRYALTTLEIEKKVLEDKVQDVKHLLSKWATPGQERMNWHQKGINYVRKIYRGEVKKADRELAILEKQASKQKDINSFEFSERVKPIRAVIDWFLMDDAPDHFAE